MKSMSGWMVIVVATFLAGCSGLHYSGGNKNMAVVDISPEVFTVNFCGNAYMSSQDVEKYAMQRAAMETLSKGYTYFTVMKKDDQSEVCPLPFRSNEQLTPYGESGGMPSSSYVKSFKKPDISLTVQMYRNPEHDNSVDANAFLKENFPGLMHETSKE